MLFWALRRPDDALGAVDRAAERWPEPAWRRRLDPLRLYLLFLAAGPAASLAETERVLADPPANEHELRRIEVVHAANLLFTGRGREGQALCRRLRPSVPLRDVHEEVALDICAVVGLDAGEDLPEHGTWLLQTLEAGIRANDKTAAAITAMHLAVIRRLEGRFAEAARWADEAVAHFERRDTFSFLALAHSVVADVAREVGDADRAVAAAAAAHAALDQLQAHDTERVWHIRGEASAQYAAGDHRSAQRTLLEAADRHADLPIYEAVLRYEAMRAGAAARALLPAMRTAHARCDSSIVDVFAAHVEARAAGDGAALLAAADAFEAVGATRFGCEAAAHAAEAFAAEGRSDSARRAAARCRELHTPDQGGTLPAMRGIADDAALTSREAQLVELAARGLSNAEIAEQLVLSVRTVESHLYRAMHKLGISDRRDLRRSR
jgi:DNA-binding NarL/FixJ family response regulator